MFLNNRFTQALSERRREKKMCEWRNLSLYRSASTIHIFYPASRPSSWDMGISGGDRVGSQPSALFFRPNQRTQWHIWLCSSVSCWRKKSALDWWCGKFSSARSRAVDWCLSQFVCAPDPSRFLAVLVHFIANRSENNAERNYGINKPRRRALPLISWVTLDVCLMSGWLE